MFLGLFFNGSQKRENKEVNIYKLCEVILMFSFNMFETYEVTFEIYIEDKLINKQTMQAPKEILMANFTRFIAIIRCPGADGNNFSVSFHHRLQIQHLIAGKPHQRRHGSHSRQGRIFLSRWL